MSETKIEVRVNLSSHLTSFLKYFPLIVASLDTFLSITTGPVESAIIPFIFVFVGLGFNYFIVYATVDKSFIYIKQWTKVIKYPIDTLDKVGDFAKGVTIIDIKTSSSTTKTFLIINDSGPALFSDTSKDISTFLISVKAAYLAKKEDDSEN